jgi:hypothetical protein
MIDEYAGHPEDPQLPAGTVGASDEALMATSSREIADLLNVGIAFARENVGMPRYLFALGRAALFHGYERLASELLAEAASHGSGAASAYLGFQASAEGDFAAARGHLEKALERGFETPDVSATLTALTDATFDPIRFNRPDLIKALHQEDLVTLHKDAAVSRLYVGTLHNTLWSDNILFIVDDASIFLELDPSVSVKAGIVSTVGDLSVAKWLKAVFSDEELAVLQDQATQDARRLALLYETSPLDFRRVYRGVRSFLGLLDPSF